MERTDTRCLIHQGLGQGERWSMESHVGRALGHVMSSALLARAGCLGRMLSFCSMLGPRPYGRCRVPRGSHRYQEALAKRNTGWGGGRRQKGSQVLRVSQVPFVWLFLSGFSITELQRKQAMLNASKQQAAGKPKGTWMVPSLLTAAQP